jgi:hypothetical protein
MDALIGTLVGALAGLHASTWGMFKDAIYEGFAWPRYFRSMIVGAVLGAAAAPLSGMSLREPGNLVLYFGLIYVLERGAIEFWKTFLRTEDQSKYFIPMQFHVLGKVIDSRAKRLAVGIPFALVVILAFLFFGWLDRSRTTPATLWGAIGAASVGGWIAAIGGAWKDAPIEGFEPLKFLRSPLTTITLGIIMALFTDSLLLIALASLGYERAVIETYKTFFFPNKPRGKFAGKEIKYPEMLRRRLGFVPVYVTIWLAVLTTLAFALAAPRHGLVAF